MIDHPPAWRDCWRMAEPTSIVGGDSVDHADTEGRRPTTRELLVRRTAAGGCAGVVAGLVGAVAGRLAMSLLASLNPEDAGITSDDGFVIGQVTLGGSAQLAAATMQLTVVGGALYLLLRPFLVGTGAVRVVTSAVGFGVTFAAVVIHPDGVDFTRLEPEWLGIVLFVAVPVLVVAVYSALAEQWMGDGSWFMTAPRGHVVPLLTCWVFAGFGLALVVPVFLVALGIASLVTGPDRRAGTAADGRAGFPAASKRVGQAVLVAIAGFGSWALAGDLSSILG